MLRYLHLDKLIEVPAHAADLTVLDHLREDRQCCGTKEGCASGDCGACTVVIAESKTNTDGTEALVYRSVNSCITLAGALHGKQLITVENLQAGEQLHPAQQCMVDCHGSQCGFCTPGFVMSIFAAMKNSNGEANRELIDEQLGGNLCRCTGYRPIVNAAEQALAAADMEDKFSSASPQVLQQLAQINATDNTQTTQFYRPRTLDELCQLRAELPNAMLLGGGTDLTLAVTQQLKQIDQVIMLGSVAELNYVEEKSNALVFGGGVSLNVFREQISAYCPELEPLLVRFGGTQVRNQATVAGNFANASPVGDLPPVFIALRASMALQSIRGVRMVDVEDFFLSYKKTILASDEIVSGFSIPLQSLQSQSEVQVVNRFYKISKRLDDDISAVCAAFHMQLKGDRIVHASVAFGGMAEIPKRATAVEAALTGNVLDDTCLKAASVALQQDFNPIDDVRASAAYRKRVCENLLTRLATEIQSPQVMTMVGAL